MHIGLFVPCYVDQFYPDVAVATLELLESCGMQVEFPSAQTCCGQPMANTGCAEMAVPLAERFVEIFQPYDFVVCPSGSCTAMVVHHYDHLFSGEKRAAFETVRDKTLELSQFLERYVPAEKLNFPSFPHRVGLHQSCHGLRELRIGACSERMVTGNDSVGELLERVPDLTRVTLKRADECCGFGGTFAVAEADVSVAMGLSRVADHAAADAEVIVAGDMSCLMHMQGLMRRDGSPLRVMHLAQLLCGRSIDINHDAKEQRR